MIGTIINDTYEIRHALSESHQYEIFTALERETGATVVVKLLREEMCLVPERVQMFCEEVKAFAGLTHQAIVHILDIGMHGQRPYVVTELIEGLDLKTWMQAEPVSFKDAARAIQEVAVVLQYAFDQKVSRRSIKTSNLFRTRSGAIKVLSFSHPRLKLVGAENRVPDEAAGTQADLFFLGTTFYEMLSGESPLRKRGGIQELWEARLRQALRLRHPHLTPEDMDKVVDFIDRTLTRNVHRRFESHAAFLMALSDLMHSSEGALRKDRQATPRAHLATAAEVVDAIQGRLPGGAMAAVGAFARGGPAGAGAAAIQARNGDRTSAGAARPGLVASRLGAVAMAEVEAPAEPGDGMDPDLWPELEGEATATPARPRLSLVRGGDTGTGVIWRKADEQTVWWRNPLWLMGVLLVLMILLIVLW